MSNSFTLCSTVSMHPTLTHQAVKGYTTHPHTPHLILNSVLRRITIVQIVKSGPLDLLQPFVDESFLDHLHVADERAVKHNATQDRSAIFVLDRITTVGKGLRTGTSSIEIHSDLR